MLSPLFLEVVCLADHDACFSKMSHLLSSSLRHKRYSREFWNEFSHFPFNLLLLSLKMCLDVRIARNFELS